MWIYKSWSGFILDFCLLQSLIVLGSSRRHRSADLVDVRDPSPPKDYNPPSTNININGIVDGEDLDTNRLTNQVDFIWSSNNVAIGDTAVLHCSFDAIFAQLRNGNIDWMRESSSKTDKPSLVATGKQVVISDRRYRVFRPHNSALSVLIIRRAKKRDAGIYKCNLAGSSTRQKYMILNVTDSKIEAKTSQAKLKTRVGRDVTLWCNATGYPKPIVYWTREDRNRKLPDGSYQHWGNGLTVQKPTEADTGIYACYLDNFVQPVVSYKFSLMVEDRPWNIDGYKMRFDSSQWFPHDNDGPIPITGKSFLLMCETKGSPKPVPHIKWYRDGKPIRNSRHFYIIEDKPEWRSSYMSSTLVIMRFVPRHQANYTCVATNVFRTRRRDFYIQGYLQKGDVTPEGDAHVDNGLNPYDPDRLVHGFQPEDYDNVDYGNERVPSRPNRPPTGFPGKRPGKGQGPQDKPDEPTGPTDDEDYEVGSGKGNGDDDEENADDDFVGSGAGGNEAKPKPGNGNQAKPEEGSTLMPSHETGSGTVVGATNPSAQTPASGV